MKKHRPAFEHNNSGEEWCMTCGAERNWFKRTPWLLKGKPQPYCAGYDEYKEKNHNVKKVIVAMR